MRDVRLSKNAIYGPWRRKNGRLAVSRDGGRASHKLDRAINQTVRRSAARKRTCPLDFVCSTAARLFGRRKKAFRLILIVKRDFLASHTPAGVSEDDKSSF